MHRLFSLRRQLNERSDTIRNEWTIKCSTCLLQCDNLFIFGGRRASMCPRLQRSNILLGIVGLCIERGEGKRKMQGARSSNSFVEFRSLSSSSSSPSPSSTTTGKTYFDCQWQRTCTYLHYRRVLPFFSTTCTVRVFGGGADERNCKFNDFLIFVASFCLNFISTVSACHAIVVLKAQNSNVCFSILYRFVFKL